MEAGDEKEEAGGGGGGVWICVRVDSREEEVIF
jgi:hypothetical protein